MVEAVYQQCNEKAARSRTSCVVPVPTRMYSGCVCSHCRVYSGPQLLAILTTAERLIRQTRGRILPALQWFCRLREMEIFALYTSISAEILILSLQRFSGSFLHHDYIVACVGYSVDSRSLQETVGVPQRFPLFGCSRWQFLLGARRVCRQ